MSPQFMQYLPAVLVREIEAGRAAVVGGAVRSHYEGVVPTDVDVFVFDVKNHARLVQALGAVERPDTSGMVYELDGEVAIDIVYLAGWGSVAACAARADFDIAAGTYCAGQFVLPVGYEEAVENKTMRFLGVSEEAQLSYGRYIKYNRRYGYKIDGSIKDLLRMWKEQKDN